jgi:hypothetical protein
MNETTTSSGGKRLLIPIGLTILFALILLWPAWSNSLKFFDDSHLAFESEHLGFWAPTKVYLDYWGPYRLGYLVLLSPVYALSDQLWLVKLIGVLLHIGTSILARLLWLRLGGGRLSGAVVLISILLYPFALEAVAWPATIPEYALGPFVLLLGAMVATGQRRRAALWGGLIMGSSLLLHEQLLVPLIAVTIALLVRDRRDRRDLTIGVSVTGGLAALLVLLSFGGNPRLSGADGPTLGHVLDNLSYITEQLRRSTPFGDFFWSTGGFALPGVVLMAVLGAMITLTWVLPRAEAEGSPKMNPLAAIGLAVFAWLGSVLPIISSGFPWHTPRVMYIPAIAMAFFLGGMTEALSQRLPHPIATGALTALVVGWSVWGAMALGTEAESLETQLHLNDQRLDSLVASVDPSKDLTDTSLLVVAGFPGLDHQRPIFGEHMIGITSGEIRARLGFRVYQATPKPSFDVRSGWEGLCLAGDGRMGLMEEYAASKGLEVPADGASFVVWVDGGWSTQRGSGPLGKAEELAAILPQCPDQ